MSQVTAFTARPPLSMPRMHVHVVCQHVGETAAWCGRPPAAHRRRDTLVRRPRVQPSRGVAGAHTTRVCGACRASARVVHPTVIMIMMDASDETLSERRVLVSIGCQRHAQALARGPRPHVTQIA